MQRSRAINPQDTISDSPEEITLRETDGACNETSDSDKTRIKSSTSSIDSGYGGSESTRTSYSILETICEKQGEIISSRCSPGSSEYETAHTSLEGSVTLSVESEAIQTPPVASQEPNEDQSDMHETATLPSARMCESTEQDGPHHRPPLQTSQSMDCPPTRKKPVLRRQSRTEKQFSSEDLQKALTQLIENHNCKELDEKHEAVLKQTMRDRAADFRQYTDFSILHAHLVKERLVHASESEFLNKECFTHTEKANKFFFEILERKGPTAYRSFYHALRAEKQHKGHDNLVEILEGALMKSELQNSYNML